MYIYVLYTYIYIPIYVCIYYKYIFFVTCLILCHNALQLTTTVAIINFINSLYCISLYIFVEDSKYSKR